MIRRWILMTAMVLTVLMPLAALIPAGDAEAFAGRARWHGYFTNAQDTMGGACGGGDVLCGGVWPGLTNPAADFINRVWGAINSGPGQNSTGAAFIVLTMMGYPPGTPKAQALNIFWTDWAPAVGYYDSQGWVQWHTWASGNVENTYWQGSPGPDDVAWYTDVVGSEAILFLNPNTGGTYWIRKACANPLGTLAALTLPPDYNVTVAADRNGSPEQVVAGRTYSVGASIANSGPGPSEGGVMQIMRPGQVSLPCAPDCAAPGMGAAGALTAGGFRNGSGVPGPGFAGQNWFYNGPPMAAGGFGRGVTQFTVAPGTPVGTTITFNVHFYKANRGGAVASSSITFRVVSERAPGVQGFNADIHAGGGLCGVSAPVPGGAVTGNSTATSMGQYVVSAALANGINNFKSNGTGADTLRMGQSGNYGIICRPDLAKAAQEYRNAGVGYTTNNAASVDVSGLSGVVYLDHPAVRIRGTVNNKLTLVAANDVEIDGVIQLSNAVFPSRSVPSLGVIANGDIRVRAGVTRVDAYLFANGEIDTCLEASIACATPPLVVNGFFMARGILLHRIGPLNSNGTPVTEQVTLNPQIYLNPPRLFDASVDDILLQGQGERRPLF